MFGAMIDGAHIILYSSNADADRAFLKDILGLPSVDVGDGWLIFALPPAEVAVHPSDGGTTHELYFMTSNAEKLVADLTARGIACDPVANRGWGLLTTIQLPGGSKLGAYEPRHARATWKAAKPAKKAKPKAKPNAKAKPKKKPAKRR